MNIINFLHCTFCHKLLLMFAKKLLDSVKVFERYASEIVC